MAPCHPYHLLCSTYCSRGSSLPGQSSGLLPLVLQWSIRCHQPDLSRPSFVAPAAPCTRAPGSSWYTTQKPKGQNDLTPPWFKAVLTNWQHLTWIADVGQPWKLPSGHSLAQYWKYCPALAENQKDISIIHPDESIGCILKEMDICWKPRRC